jgi:ABC-type nitrate/sulfonate/bicarbonate transport system permease component
METDNKIFFEKVEPFLIILILLVGWQLLSTLKLINPTFLPSPIDIGFTLYSLLFTPMGGATLLTHVFASLEKFFAGFLFSTALGVLLGILMGWNEKVNSVVSPFFEVLRFIPPIAWISFAILWFGLGLAAQAYIIGIGVFVPTLENSRQTIRLIDPVYIQAARTFGAKGWSILWKVVIPAGLPILIAGIRIGLGIGWMCLVAAEMISRPSLIGGEGLGYLIETARMNLRSDYIISGMIMIGSIGYCLDIAIKYIEKRLCPWRG